jgi:AcrR family transcriptional regulator
VRPDDQPDGKTFVDVARRAQLIRCTIDAIAEVGYRKASLAEIARRAGITKAAIFYHFTNRDDLMHAVFHHVLDTGSEYILPRVQAAPTPRAQLRAYVTAFVESLQVDPKAVQVLFTIAKELDGDPPRSAEDAALPETAVAVLEDILRRGQAAGEFGEFPLRSMALMMRATLEAVPIYLTDYPGLDAVAYGQDLITFFERACLARRPGRR